MSGRSASTDVIRVLRGSPDDHELAAVVTALLAATALRELADPPPARAPRWSARSARMVAPPGERGGASWRQSGWN